MTMARSCGMRRLKAGLLTLDEAELQAKNSSIAPEILSELTLIKLLR